MYHSISKLIPQVLIVCAILFRGAPALGFESFPEYSSAKARDVKTQPSPILIGSENQSDYLTYLIPLEWEAHWLHSNRAMDSTTGSLNSTRFLIKNRLKFKKELIENFNFKFLYFEESDFEINNRHVIFEFEKWFRSSRIGLAIEGESLTQKAEDDFGLAVLFRGGNTQVWRLFHRFIDFSKNEKNEASDRYNTQPTLSGIVYRNSIDRDQFLELSLSFMNPFAWRFPDEGIEYNYREALFRMNVRKKIDGSADHWGGRLHLEKTSQKNGSGLQNNYREIALFQIEREVNEWTFGYHFANRKFDNKTNVTHHLPYGGFRIGSDTSQWQIGMDSTFFKKTGASREDYRLNVIHERKFGTDTDIRFLLTFDVDRFGSKESWEGGNIQFHTLL